MDKEPRSETYVIVFASALISFSVSSKPTLSVFDPALARPTTRLEWPAPETN